MIDFPIIDSHVHLLDPKRFSYSWIKGAPVLARAWSADDLAAAAKPYSVEGFVFVEADVDLPQHVAEAEWVDELSRGDRRVFGCVAALPLECGKSVEAEMARIAKLPVIRGVRRLIQNQPNLDFVLQPDFIDALKLLPKYDLSFDICIFHHQFENTLTMVRRCPEVSFILDHIAKPGIKAGQLDPWRQNMRELSRQPNVVCKLSGVTNEADHKAWTREQLRPYIVHAIDCFGCERIMFGGDWPVSELADCYTEWIQVLDWVTSGCTAGEKRNFFRDNAIKAYRLNMA